MIKFSFLLIQSYCEWSKFEPLVSSDDLKRRLRTKEFNLVYLLTLHAWYIISFIIIILSVRFLHQTIKLLMHLLRGQLASNSWRWDRGCGGIDISEKSPDVIFLFFVLFSNFYSNYEYLLRIITRVILMSKNQD